MNTLENCMNFFANNTSLSPHIPIVNIFEILECKLKVLIFFLFLYFIYIFLWIQSDLNGGKIFHDNARDSI